MQTKLRSVLECMLQQSHPDKPRLYSELMDNISDLRTLNTLHSEKLTAFKMTEQQRGHYEQQQQQYMREQQHQHQQQQQDCSPWHDSYDDESAKSPMGSVSSSESLCCSEMVAMSDLPLLASVAIGGGAGGAPAPLLMNGRRRRVRDVSQSENGSLSSDGEESLRSESRAAVSRSSNASSVSGGIGMGGANGITCPYKMRKLELSADDSGIESGVDRYEKLSTASQSTNTSLCSSPRSSLDEKVKEMDDAALSAPVIPAPAPTPAVPAPTTLRATSVDDMPVLKRVLQAPPLFDTNSLMDEAYKPHKKFRALHQRRPESVESVQQQQQYSSNRQQNGFLFNSSSTSNYSTLCSSQSSSPLLASTLSSSLTSTHSTIARSLMQAPKLNSEQQRQADLIAANIMKGDPAPVLAPTSSSSSSSPSYSSPLLSASLLASSLSSSSPQHYASSGHYASGQQQQQQQQQQQSTVLTSGPLYNAGGNSPNWNYQRPSSRMLYEQAQSPLQQQQQQRCPQQQQPDAIVELQVGIGDSQPLNLSLKSPSASPDRPVTPLNHVHYFPLHA